MREVKDSDASFRVNEEGFKRTHNFMIVVCCFTPNLELKFKWLFNIAKKRGFP